MKNEQKNWYSVEIETIPAAEEAVEFALNELESLGNEINHLGKKTTENLMIIGYFNERVPDEILREKLDVSLKIHALSADSVKGFRWQPVENQDWLAEWKKHWKPTETAKFIIAPLWENVENTNKIVIRIEPSMAFGTGTHETTRLCLKAIEENYDGKMSFLDVGTGTGILAIGAAKIQGKNEKLKGKILACDTDFDSIIIAKENAEINETPAVELYIGSISDETPEFDYICANLTADVILPILPLLIEKSKRILVLSGILKEQEDLIVAELTKFQVTNYKIETDGEWIALQIKR